ncbi:MAG: hypothetical protein ABSG03_00275 [Bryobacteraceae bacterium]
MTKRNRTAWIAPALAAGLIFPASKARADQLNCSLAEYRAQPGLTAAVAGDTLTVIWEGDRNQELRLRFEIDGGAPVIEALAARRKGEAWVTLAANAAPDFRVVSGLRRITNQQLDPLAGIGVKITPEILEREKWEAFWDAPLNVPGGDAAHNDCTPPQRGVLNQPGLPRNPDEVKRAAAVYHAQSCGVRSNGARLEIWFPGVQLGVFAGRLQYTVYKGTNLIRQEVIASTREPSVAYKYDAGIRGVAIGPAARVAWQDVTNRWQEYRFGGAANEAPVTVTSSNRIVAAEAAGGAIAAFPPPHNFFWARETSFNLGYNWYRKDSAAAYSFGVREAEEEGGGGPAQGGEDRRQNFALRSARPGTEQRMPVYLYASLGSAQSAVDAALAFTRGDHFKPLAGYQVMATHFHMGLAAKAQRAGGLDAKVADLEVLKAAGINIVAPIDGGGVVPMTAGAATTTAGRGATGGRGGQVDDAKWLQWTRGLGAPPDLVLDQALAYAGVTRADLHLADAAEVSPAAPAGAGRGARGGANGGRGGADLYRGEALYYETARRQSDRNFVVMPNAELLRGEVARDLGGHSDLLMSHPVFWTQGRAAGQPLVEDNATYGRVYHVGNVEDMMEMAHRENILIYMPHPRSKGSTGFPDAIEDTAHFLDASYRGIGFRWGMGLDGSEQRLCEYRCLPLFDDMNNWVADKPTPPKYIQAISEIYGETYGDDIYANNPVNYVKIDSVPPPGEWGPIVNAMKTGNYFVTSGEVLITSYSVQGAGAQRTVSADVEWTFPLEFVEVVWGDGQRTDRKIISGADLPAFGKHRFQIPVSTAGKKWVRFAAWDSAGNGAMAQPVKLTDGAAEGR